MLVQTNEYFVREQRLDLLSLLARFNQLLLDLLGVLTLRESLRLGQIVRQQDLRARYSDRDADNAM